MVQNILRKNFEIVSIEEFENRLKNKCFTNREVVLTFDDGYANNLYVVEPILRKYKLPFTVFVSTHNIETGEFFPTSVNRIILRGAGLKEVVLPSQNLKFILETPDDINNAECQISNLLKRLPLCNVEILVQELIDNVSPEQWNLLQKQYHSVRPMTWLEVKELSSREGVTIGSHCRWHICCHECQTKEDLSEQIKISKKEIETHLEKECRYFAYPNGNYTDYSNDIVESVYSFGFSTEMRKSIKNNSRVATIPRIGVPATLDTFKILVNLYPKK